MHAWSARSLAPPCCASLQTLEAVATKLGSHAPVAKALCNIFAAAMTAAKQQLAALLGTLCNAIVGMYTAHHHPACLEAIGVAVEVWCHTQPKPTQQATPPQQTTMTHTHTLPTRCLGLAPMLTPRRTCTSCWRRFANQRLHS